jgi:hypothetical protein
MGQLFTDLFTDNPGVDLVDHVGGVAWRPHPDYSGTFRSLTAWVISNPLDPAEGLFYGDAMPSTADVVARFSFDTVGTSPPDNAAGFAYRIQLDDKSYYRVRRNGANWVLEKVVNGAITQLASTATPIWASGERIQCVLAAIGSKHFVWLQNVTSSVTATMTATDSSILSAGYFGIWGSGGGTASGSAPSQNVADGVRVVGSTAPPSSGAFEVGTNSISLTPTAATLTANGSNTLSVASVDETIPLLSLFASDALPYVATLTLPVVTLAGDFAFGTYVLETLPELTLTGVVLTGSTVDEILPSFQLDAQIDSGNVGTVSETLPVVQIIAATGVSVIETLPELTSAGVIATGNLATVGETLPALDMAGAGIATSLYAIVENLPSLGMSAVLLPGNRGTVAEQLPSFSASAFIFSGNFSTIAEALPALQLAATARSSSTNTGDSALPSLQMFAEAVQTVSEALATSLSSPAQAWALNLRNEALSQYTNFALNSMTFFNGKYIGASDAGIVEIGVQATDGGTAIAGRVRTGAHDGDSSFLKRLPYLYVQLETTGDMTVSTITAEDGQRDYLLPWNNNPNIQQRRAHFGRGPKSQFWQVEFANRNGSYFRIPSFDTLQRRSHRRMQ